MPAPVNREPVQPVRSASGAASMRLLSRGEGWLELRGRGKRTELRGATGTGYRDLRGAGATAEPRGPHRLGLVAALVDDPPDTVHIVRTGRVHVRVDGRHEPGLVRVALRDAQVHAAGREVSDGRRAG